MQDPNILTGSTTSKYFSRPVAPQDIHEDLYYRLRSMEVQVSAEYNQRMALAQIDNINYDPNEAGVAATIYQGDISRIHGYRAEIQAKWKTIDNANQFDNDQKLALKYKVLNSTGEPIHIPKIRQEKPIFSDKDITKGLGSLATRLDPNSMVVTGQMPLNSPQDANLYMMERFGPQWEQEIPQARQLINQRFATQTPTLEKPVSIKEVKRIRFKSSDGRILTVPESQWNKVLEVDPKAEKL